MTGSDSEMADALAKETTKKLTLHVKYKNKPTSGREAIPPGKPEEAKKYHWCGYHGAWVRHTEDDCKLAKGFKKSGGIKKKSRDEKMTDIADKFSTFLNSIGKGGKGKGRRRGKKSQ